MSRRSYLLLFVGSVLVSSAIACFQSFPGYLDSDYYFAGGLQLVTGRGFTEPFLWNYLEETASVQHPSHGYWMPLASIVAAASMAVTGQHGYAGARIFFLLLSGLPAILTAALAYSFTARRDLSVTSGILATFTGFYAPFLPVTDNFGTYMVLGGAFLLVLHQGKSFFWLGLIAGLMALARTDGALWLVLAFAAAFSRVKIQGPNAALAGLGLALGGFLLIMLPWYARNLDVFGAVFSPGGSRVLWLTEYDQIFTFPADRLSFASWIQSGWRAILQARTWALLQNAQSAIIAQGGIVLAPLVLLGASLRWKDLSVRIGVLGWILAFAAMTVLVPFAGARGGFFHASAAFQPLWWALAPVGLESAVNWARGRGRFTPGAQTIFRVILVQVLVLVTGYVAWLRIFSLGWGEGEVLYPRIDQLLVEHRADPRDIVVVRNPAGYYIATGRSAIVIPYGGVEAIEAVARHYSADFLILEQQAVIGDLQELYDDTADYPGFAFLGEVVGARVYEIEGH